MEQVAYSRYLGEDSWIEIIANGDGTYYERENTYGGEWRDGKTFASLQDAIDYAKSVC
jgi:hypothetical protein